MERLRRLRILSHLVPWVEGAVEFDQLPHVASGIQRQVSGNVHTTATVQGGIPATVLHLASSCRVEDHPCIADALQLKRSHQKGPWYGRRILVARELHTLSLAAFQELLLKPGTVNSAIRPVQKPAAGGRHCSV